MSVNSELIIFINYNSIQVKTQFLMYQAHLQCLQATCGRPIGACRLPAITDTAPGLPPAALVGDRRHVAGTPRGVTQRPLP